MLDPKTTALVVIDLQRGIVGRSLGPRDGAEVVANAAQLANALRKMGGYVVLVRVTFSPDGKDALQPPVDEPMVGGERPANWDEIMPEMGPMPGDLVVDKRQWGAFYGTELDLQLRRRGIQTILLCGISTNFGVESTARNAFELGYAQIFVEDAMAGMSAEAHEFPLKHIFPRIGKIRSTQQVLAELRGS